MKRLGQLLALALALSAPVTARADFSFTSSGSAVGYDFTCFSSKHCFASVIITSAGVELFTSTTPAYVQFGTAQNVNATQAGAWSATVVQPTAANLNMSAVQSGTWLVTAAQATAANLNMTAVQGGAWTVTANQSTATAFNATVVQPTAANLNVTAAEGGTWTVTATQATATSFNATVVQPTAANLNVTASEGGTWTVNPTTIGTWGLAASTQNVASPTNGGLVLGQFNTTPTTVASGNASPLQMDSAGNLLVNIKAGAAAGGTSSSFGAAFPATGTALGLTNGTNMVAWSATTTYGTAPAAIAVPAVNAYVTNSNPNSQATMANSSPVVIASNQSAYPINIQTGGGTAINFGQAVMASSLPVVLSSNQSTIPINNAQVGGATYALGGNTVANSQPVTPSNQPIGGATLAVNQISVAATSTLIAAARTGNAGTGRVSITVTNTGTTAVYIGPTTGVTTTTGTLLPGILGASLTLNTTSAVYGIAASGSQTVSYVETY